MRGRISHVPKKWIPSGNAKNEYVEMIEFAIYMIFICIVDRRDVSDLFLAIGRERASIRSELPLFRKRAAVAAAVRV